MSDTEDNQQKITKEFRNNVIKYLDIDDEIRNYRIKTKDLLKEKKEFEDKILNFLESVEEQSIVVRDGKLIKNISKTKAPLKKESIFKSLLEITGDNTKALTLTDHIINSRPTVERVNLKRTKNRKKNEN
jgi:uncharacterized HAD superfamily protein